MRTLPSGHSLMLGHQHVSPYEEICSSRAQSHLELKDVIKNHVIRVYEEQGGNVSATASILGIGRHRLKDKLKQYGIKWNSNDVRRNRKPIKVR